MTKMTTEAIANYLDTHFEYLGHKIQVDMSEVEHANLFKRIQRQWTSYGETEPYASVLSDKEFERNNIANSLAQLSASGDRMVQRLVHLLSRNGLTFPKGDCLELGCGVGRLTKPLASLCEKVYALDISPGNLKVCQDYLKDAGVDNVKTALLTSPTDIGDIELVDAFVSLIVLQHNPPPIQYFILNKILAKIRPNGVAFFQTATYNPGYHYSIDMHMALNEEQFDSWSMHCLPMRHIMQLLKAHDFDVLEVIEDGLTGGLHKKFHSHSFLARKR